LQVDFGVTRTFFTIVAGIGGGGGGGGGGIFLKNGYSQKPG
jgi:hypothetical protein